MSDLETSKKKAYDAMRELQCRHGFSELREVIRSVMAGTTDDALVELKSVLMDDIADRRRCGRDVERGIAPPGTAGREALEAIGSIIDAPVFTSKDGPAVR